MLVCVWDRTSRARSRSHEDMKKPMRTIQVRQRRCSTTAEACWAAVAAMGVERSLLGEESYSDPSVIVSGAHSGAASTTHDTVRGTSAGGNG